MSLLQTLKIYKNHINALKYNILEEYQTNPSETLHYNIMVVNLTTDASAVKRIIQTPPVEVTTLMGLDTINQDIESKLCKFMITLSAFNEVLAYKSAHEQEMLRTLAENLNSRDLANSTNLLGEMSVQGILTASIELLKKSIQDMITCRISFKNEYKQEIGYLFKCVHHTWKNDDITQLKELGMSDFLEFCCKYFVLDGESMKRLYEMMVALSDVSVSTYTNMYENMVMAKVVECIDIDHLIRVAFKAYRMYKSDNTSVSAVETVISLLSFIDTVSKTVPIELEEYDDESVFGFIMIILDMFKYVAANKDKITSSTVDMNAVCYSLLAKVIDNQPGILDSYMLRHIPYTILSNCSRTDGRFKNFKRIFSALSEYSRFYQYIASFATPDMRQVLNTAFNDNPKALKKIDLKMNIYEAMSEMDQEGTYKDELTGCTIVMPGILHLGERDIWIDRYAFLSYLYDKPQNPYTRERLTPEEFRKMQKEKSVEIREYSKDRKEFLAKIMDDE